MPCKSVARGSFRCCAKAGTNFSWKFPRVSLSEQESSQKVDAIRVEGLSKRYGNVKAIDNISFSVERGQVVGFLGPNGAGKSTTMRILCGLMSATSGRAYICGIPVASHPNEIKRHIGYMPEHNPLPSDMRVIEYLRYRGRLREIPGRQLKARVDEAMEVCDLHRKARRKLIGALSKGYRQRVGIADAILAQPDVIIMDEPTIGLDPHQILAIRKLIESLRGRMTVVISSHILPEIELVCDRVIIINQGHLVASGEPAVLRREFVTKKNYRFRAAASVEDIRHALSATSASVELEPIGPVSDTGHREFRMEFDRDAASPESILRTLASNPALGLTEFSRQQATLEDIFMAATKRSWDETAAPFPTRNGAKNA